MLQQAEEEDGPAEGRGRGVELFFMCDDVDALHAEFISADGEDGPAASCLLRHEADILKDPDGYELCFESPADAR
jgi:hypothetical protein